MKCCKDCKVGVCIHDSRGIYHLLTKGERLKLVAEGGFAWKSYKDYGFPFRYCPVCGRRV